jgi:hypothetical protein
VKVYVLSLPEDDQRRDSLKWQFPEHFSSFEIVPAIDGRCKPPDYDVPQYPNNCRRPLSSTEAACALGHMRIYSQILNCPDTSSAFSLVMEDDVQGNKEQLGRIEWLATQLPPQSLVILGGLQNMPRARHLYGYTTPWTGTYRISVSQRRNLTGAYCYLLDARMAEHLRRQQSHCLNRADDWAYLAASEPHVFYAPIMSHPSLDGDNSHIEKTRAFLYQGGIIQRWQRDGWRESLARPAARLLTPIAAAWLGMKLIHPERGS